MTQVVRETPISQIPYSPVAPHVASDSQRAAIEAELGPVLVLAGPGAGKTFCLIERIRFLVEMRDIDPSRICAFTYTNKAAGEISSRLEKYLGARAHSIQKGTIHSFCVQLLREHGMHVGVQPGFGIADDEYQKSVLRRIRVPQKYHPRTIRAFTSYRFVRDYAMDQRDIARFDEYTAFLERRNIVDFDMLILKTGALLRIPEVCGTIRQRWDCVLVDEFQDLTAGHYRIVQALAHEHRNIFVVGDEDQSIFSWAGADRGVFESFLNDFGIKEPTTHLMENRRCPVEIVELAYRILQKNTRVTGRVECKATRNSAFQPVALKFAEGDAELGWVVDDIRRDRETSGLPWSAYAVLYRLNDLGNMAESRFLASGIPCRMAQGRALSDDSVVRYVMAALRVISQSDDVVHHEGFLNVVLPKALFDRVRAKADSRKRDMLAHLERTAGKLPKDDVDGKKLRRAVAALRNLAAISSRHQALKDLIDDLLSQKVGEYQTLLEVHCDELSDPASNTEVEMLAAKLAGAFDRGQAVWIPRLGGVEIALKGILIGIGINRVHLGGLPPADSIAIRPSDCESLGIVLGVFKAAQLMRSGEFANRFRDFTAVDIETTDNNLQRAELVEIAAVRVRNGIIVDEFKSLVRPEGPISPAAFDTHHISEHDVSDAPTFAEVWPLFREFCRGDMLVAHNGHGFDFPILRRLAGEIEFTDFSTYDTLALAREIRTGSASLVNLAKAYGIPTGQSHRALDDTRTLAYVFLALSEEKVTRTRKIALEELLDHVGVGLCLSEHEQLCKEAELLREETRFRSLGRWSNCLEFYGAERDRCTETLLPTVDELVERLGGETLRLKLKTDKTAEQRYPDAMMRLRPLVRMQAEKPLSDQIAGLLERIALSRWEGVEPDSARVNLLTLHSTKGLEFSRVYIMGTDDAGFARTDRTTKEEIEELRRLLYVGMTRTIERLVLTCAETRNGESCGGHFLLDEMNVTPAAPTVM